ncbi:ComEA family DNA-binding protein [Roseateles puraquae]|jgi:competence protein ComEA|uniref:DNA-binding protein n=1 Tax=Roseateles puraquae TaxID=431059 RepID=A0A254NB34_9BURK|nr:helix-hairpin-helix domain-containing protein [Roseateles puraquae]MDG0852812.1 helix-hairpin-helix domain-containing protein [Roseateles puraquae]OWR05181.1 hypothetical protein CDO81_01495 [Roseateles puraquae]
MRRRALLLSGLAAPAFALTAIEVNTAKRATLESVPGLGPALVQRLLAARPFTGWPDLMQRVPGIKAATATRLSAAGLRVAGEAFESAAGGKAG